MSKMENNLNEVMVNGEKGWVCPKCGAALSPKVTICPKCGYKNPNAESTSYEDLEANRTSSMKPLNS